MELFSSLPQSKPNYLAEYCQGGPENQDLPTLAGR